MKFLHISDLHYPDSGNNTAFLVAKIIEHYAAKKKKPPIVLSGDIIDTPSRKKNFLEAKEILKPLVDEGFPLMICPGNHDLKTFGAGPIILGRRRFNNYFSDLLPAGKNYFGDEDNNFYDFPIVHQFDKHFFIGMDSMAAEVGPGTTGELGEEQLDELKLILTEIRTDFPKSKIIVYLHHHPLEFEYRPYLLRLKDKAEFLNIIQGVDVLLFGHLHFIERFPEDEKKYKIKIIHLTGGSTYGRNIDWVEIDTVGFKLKRISYRNENQI